MGHETGSYPIAVRAALHPNNPSKTSHWEAHTYYPTSYRANYEWQSPLPLGGQVVLQSSTNLSDWVSYAVVTNQGMRIEWSHQVSPGSKRFFRIVPQ